MKAEKYVVVHAADGDDSDLDGRATLLGKVVEGTGRMVTGMWCVLDNGSNCGISYKNLRVFKKGRAK